MAAPTAEGDAGKGDEIIALLEGFSNKLNVVEKENRRRRNPDERVAHEGRPATSVKEELSSLKDELHNMRRSTTRPRPRPRSTLATIFKVLVVLALCVVAYLYWYRLSQPLGSIHWHSTEIGGSIGDDGEEVDGMSFLDRVHFGFRKSGDKSVRSADDASDAGTKEGTVGVADSSTKDAEQKGKGGASNDAAKKAETKQQKRSRKVLRVKS